MITIYGNDCPDGCEVIYDGYELRWNTETNNELKLTAIKLSQSIFELIEDNNIDIDSIEELEVIDFINTPGKELSREENIKLNNQVLVDYFYIINDIIRNQNQTVQAVKQLNKEIKELKEK